MKSWIDAWATLDYGELSYPVRLQLSKVIYYAQMPEQPALILERFPFIPVHSHMI